MTLLLRKVTPIHLSDEDNQESVQDHRYELGAYDPMPAGMIARLQAIVARTAQMARWMFDTDLGHWTLNDQDSEMSARAVPSPCGGWDAYVTPWTTLEAVRVGHQLTMDGAQSAAESYMRRVNDDA